MVVATNMCLYACVFVLCCVCMFCVCVCVLGGGMVKACAIEPHLTELVHVSQTAQTAQQLLLLLVLLSAAFL